MPNWHAIIKDLAQIVGAKGGRSPATSSLAARKLRKPASFRPRRLNLARRPTRRRKLQKENWCRWGGSNGISSIMVPPRHPPLPRAGRTDARERVAFSTTCYACRPEGALGGYLGCFSLEDLLRAADRVSHRAGHKASLTAESPKTELRTQASKPLQGPPTLAVSMPHAHVEI